MSMPSAFERFRDSMTIGLDAWRDGTGYDLAALREMNAEELKSVRAILQGRNDWRDAEALAAIAFIEQQRAAVDGSASPREVNDDGSFNALRRMLNDGALPLNTRLQAGEELKELGHELDLTDLVLAMLKAGREDMATLSRAMDHVEWNLPASEKLKLGVLKLLRHAKESYAFHLASLAWVAFGLCESTSDLSQREHWQRFADEPTREAAFAELIARVNADPKHLG
ncbi:MAG: hypothetical protein IBJ18_02360 [Phycisphaerales bacterium]|nr:hypothetical protein [Phycisphaerales bacterium]